MNWQRTGLVAGAAGLLVVLATARVPPELRLLAVVVVTGLVAVGQRFREPGTTALGLLGLVTAVATGPAVGAAMPGLLAWAVPTWAVVLVAAAGLGPAWPPTRDTRVGLRVHVAAVAGCAAAVPLALLVTGVGRPGAGWAVGASLGLVAGLALAAARGRT